MFGPKNTIHIKIIQYQRLTFQGGCGCLGIARTCRGSQNSGGMLMLQQSTTVVFFTILNLILSVEMIYFRVRSFKKKFRSPSKIFSAYKFAFCFYFCNSRQRLKSKTGLGAINFWTDSDFYICFLFFGLPKSRNEFLSFHKSCKPISQLSINLKNT